MFCRLPIAPLLMPLPLLCCRTPAIEGGEPCVDCVLIDDNNYRWSGSLDAGTFLLSQGQDATVDWSALTQDMFDDPLDPVADVDQAALLALPGMSPDDVAEGIAHDDLQQADAALYVFCTPSDTRCALSDFGLFGNPLDVTPYFVEGTGTWLVALLTPSQTIATLVLLWPDPGEHDPWVHVVDDTTSLEVEIDLGTLTPLTVPFGQGFSVDWSGLTRDGLSNPLNPNVLDRLLIGRYADAPSDLEDRGPALLTTADELWSIEVQGTSTDLRPLCESHGFCGVDSSATWLLALSCESCLNPAPRFVTRIVGTELEVTSP